MTYRLARDSHELGQFSEEQLRAGLLDGSCLPTDLVWAEGMAAWTPLGQVFAPQPAIVPPPIPTNVGAFPVSGAAAQTSGLAIASLVLGILSFVGTCLTGIPAIICGHVALSRINRSQGSIGGHGIAVAGLVMGYGCMLLLPVLASLAIPTFSKIQERGNQVKAMSNCRQIITTLRLYAADNGGKYPDAETKVPILTSNDVFRRLFVGGQTDNEMIFGCAVSPYHPDGNIGSSPDFLEAVKPGENHWAMTKGLNDSASGVFPLVYENPSEATWPPKWNADLIGHSAPGRSWSGGKIIVGNNDSSVVLMPLEARTGASVGLKPFTNGSSVFPENNPKLSILNVANP